MSQESLIREAVRTYLQEFKRMSDQVSVMARLQVKTTRDEDPTVPDVLTNLRAQPGVVVVKQLGAVKRAHRGREVLDVEIKFMPVTKDPHVYLEKIGRLVKQTPGVEMVKLYTINGHRTTREDGRPWVF